MAKKSWIARNERKKQTVEKYAELRLKLKAEKDYVGLSMLPRDASPTRLIAYVSIGQTMSRGILSCQDRAKTSRPSSVSTRSISRMKWVASHDIRPLEW